MREGLAGLGDGDALTRARVAAALSSSLVMLSSDEALTLAQEAEGLARGVGDEEAQLSAFTAWLWALRGRGRNAEQCEVGARAAELAAATRRVTWETSARYLYGVGLVGLGRLDAAAAEFERVGELPSLLGGWAPRCFGSTMALARGQLDEALRLADEAHAVGEALGETNEAIHIGQRVRIALDAGRFDEAGTWIERSQEVSYNFAGFEALLALETGDHEHARRLIDQFERDLPQLSPIILDYNTDSWVRVALRLDDRELAARMGAFAEPFVGQLLGTDVFLDGAGEHALGLVALIEDRLDDAVRLLKHAVGVVEALKLDRLVTKHRVDLARALLTRGARGDADRARELLIDAADVAGRMGLAPVANDARGLLR
jgi:tetratricopeptide (TPR) repeat protein